MITLAVKSRGSNKGDRQGLQPPSRTNYSVEPNYSVPRFDFMTVWEIGLVLGLVIAGGAFSLLFLGATFILWVSNKMTKPGA